MGVFFEYLLAYWIKELILSLVVFAVMGWVGFKIFRRKR